MKKNIFLAKLGILLMMLVSGSSLMSAADFVDDHVQPTLSVAPIAIGPGEEAEVVVEYDSIVGYSAFQLAVEVPDGLSIVESEGVDEDGESVKMLGAFGSSCYSSGLSRCDFRKQDNALLFAYANPNLKKMLKKGVLATFKVKADEKLAETAEIKLFDILFSGVITDGGEFNGQEYNSGMPYMTMNVPVTKKMPTGINAVNAENQQAAAIYTISGTKVSKAAKGVNIVVRNGKAIKVVK